MKTVEMLREQMGLDDPMYVQYFRFRQRLEGTLDNHIKLGVL